MKDQIIIIKRVNLQKLKKRRKRTRFKNKRNHYHLFKNTKLLYQILINLKKFDLINLINNVLIRKFKRLIRKSKKS